MANSIFLEREQALEEFAGEDNIIGAFYCSSLASSLDDEFRFQLKKEELEEILKCKNFTSSWGGSRKLPYGFTEQGIYMLMTVLKDELTAKQSIALIGAFFNYQITVNINMISNDNI